MLSQHVRPQLVRARVAVVCAVLVMQVIVPQRYSLWKGVQNVQTCCLNDTGAVSLSTSSALWAEKGKRALQLHVS